MPFPNEHTKTMAALGSTSIGEFPNADSIKAIARSVSATKNQLTIQHRLNVPGRANDVVTNIQISLPKGGPQSTRAKIEAILAGVIAAMDLIWPLIDQINAGANIVEKHEAVSSSSVANKVKVKVYTDSRYPTPSYVNDGGGDQDVSDDDA